MKSTSPPTSKLDPPRSATNRELILLRTPLDTSSSPIDPQQHQRGLPSRRRRSPDVGIPILRASDDTIGIRCPGDSRDQLIVLYPRQLRFSLESQQAYLSESLLKFPGVACLGIDLRFVVVGAYGDL